MKITEKVWTQTLPIDLESAWSYFSRPENLNELTPPDMHFDVLSKIESIKMYPGMIIRYRIKPILNIPMNWVTEITHIKEKEYFIDEQRFGPYKFWQHQHHFSESKDGILMTDILNYSIPFGLAGRIADSLFVNRKIESIFTYRKKMLSHKYNLKR